MRVQRCPVAGGGDCTTVAGGQGWGSGARQLTYPNGVAMASNGDFIVVDQSNNRVQRCPGAGGGDCTTVAGNQGAGRGAQQLRVPRGVAIASNGDFIVADEHNARVQRCPAAGGGDCTTVAGGHGRGTGNHQFSYPTAVA